MRFGTPKAKASSWCIIKQVKSLFGETVGTHPGRNLCGPVSQINSELNEENDLKHERLRKQRNRIRIRRKHKVTGV